MLPPPERLPTAKISMTFSATLPPTRSNRSTRVAMMRAQQAYRQRILRIAAAATAIITVGVLGYFFYPTQKPTEESDAGSKRGNTSACAWTL